MNPDVYKLSPYSFSELKDMAKKMDIKPGRTKEEVIRDISRAFSEYERYKRGKVDEYTRISQLGNKGKEGVTYLVKDTKDREYAMKTFKKTKSSRTLKMEYSLQKRAGKRGISPRVFSYDTVCSKYILMEKMDEHLLDVIKRGKGVLKKSAQLRILEIFNTLDSEGIFHGDANILNYMVKNGKIYIIDFGFSKEITPALIKKLGTDTPNIKIMTLGFCLTLKDIGADPISYKYLREVLSREEIDRFGL